MGGADPDGRIVRVGTATGRPIPGPALAEKTAMSILSPEDLGVTLGAPLFTDLSLTVHPGDRIGLVAANGRVDIVLDDLAIPAELRDRPLRALSGGWRRMAMLARVWVTEPDLLLMDEPTSHLDIEGQEALEAELLAGETSALLVSRDRAFVRAVGNRSWRIDGKRLVAEEGPEAFFRAALGGWSVSGLLCIRIRIFFVRIPILAIST